MSGLRYSAILVAICAAAVAAILLGPDGWRWVGCCLSVEVGAICALYRWDRKCTWQ